MNADLFKAQAIQEIEIPGFNNDIITIKVQRPRLRSLAEQGSIPNPLLGAVDSVLLGKKKGSEPDVADLSRTVMLYCSVCMVEPSFDEVKDYMTDDQMFAIWAWVNGRANKLSTFRNDKK